MDHEQLKLSRHAALDVIRLSKPGIILGNALTASAGYLLAPQKSIDIFFAMLVGLCCIIASAAIWNNMLDRRVDALMARTKNRPLVTGTVTAELAALYSSALALIGFATLTVFTHSALFALLGFLIYIGLYTPLKKRSVHATLVGSISGAMPPLVGYFATGSPIDLTSLFLFALLVFWQMPHFFAIALYRLDDYSAASIPVLPLVKGVRHTQIEMLLYILAFIPISFALTHSITMALSGLIWFILCLQGFFSKNSARWARHMFLYSLAVILLFSTLTFFRAF